MLQQLLTTILNKIVKNLPPEEVGCGNLGGYNMIRWQLLSFRGYKVRLHKFIDSDVDDMHDHPIHGLSILLTGSYIEETPTTTRLRKAGSIQVIKATHIHRVLINPVEKRETWSLFFNTPKIQPWGFYHKGTWLSVRDYIKLSACKRRGRY